MAHPLDPKPIASAYEFDMQNNPDSLGSVQANETFLVTARDENRLGNDGQIKGFAKYQYHADETLGDRSKQAEVHAQKLHKDVTVQPLHDARSRAEQTTLQMREALRTFNSTLLRPSDDPVRLGAQKDLDDLNALLKKTNEEIATISARPEVQPYLEAEAETKKLAGKYRQQNSGANSSASLYRSKDRTNMSETNPSEGGDRSMLSRSVASKLVDNFLGTGSLAEEKFGVDKDMRPIGISVQVEGASITGKFQGKSSFLDTDYSDPEIQKGLSDLEVNDFITGQIDRHLGNVFIDPVTKKVTGIDNDLAFPENTREQAIKFGGRGKAVSGLPTTVHKDTAAKILSQDPNELRRQLENMPAPNGVGKLSAGSINGAVGRLEELQAALKSGAVQVVDQFDKQTYDAAIAKQNVAVKKACNGKELSQCGPEEVLETVDPTSYVGAVAVIKKNHENAMDLKPDQYGKRPENTVAKMERDQRYQAYQKMDANQKSQYDKIAGEVGDLDKQLSACRQKQAELNVTPHGMKAVTAFFQQGKADKAMQALRKEEGDCLKGIQDKTLELDRMTSAAQKVQQGVKSPSPTDHSVRKELHMDRADAGTSVAQSVKTGQLQKAPSSNSLRKDHPEFVHAPGPKVTSPRQGQHT